MLMDIISEAARELKTWDLRESLWSYKHLIKNDSLLHRILAPIEGQFNTSRGMELDVCFGSFRIRFPNSDWKVQPKAQMSMALLRRGYKRESLIRVIYSRENL